MIEDDEFRRLFQAESDEHLQRLDDLLLALEAGVSAAGFDSVGRELHSLKGSARMLGVRPIERLAHALEGAFKALRARGTPLTAEEVVHLSAGIDSLRALAREAVSGEPAAVALDPLLQRLNNAFAITAPAAPGPEAKPPDAPSAPAAEPAAPGSPAPETVAPFRIGTVRVETERLDTLLTLAGELTVLRGRMARAGETLADMTELQQEMSGALRRAGLPPVPAAARRSAAWQRVVAGGRSSQVGEVEQMGRLLARLSALIAESQGHLEWVSSELTRGVRRIRLVPMAALFRLFPRMVHDLARQSGKQAELVIEGEQTVADKRILEEMQEPLMHLLRNAVVHGIETPGERERLGKRVTGTLYLRAHQRPAGVELTVADDGRGIDTAAVHREAVRRGLLAEEESEAAIAPEVLRSVLFSPGFTSASVTTELAGRGSGLDIVKTTVERLKGSITLDSWPGAGTTIRLRLPTSLVTSRVLLAEVGRQVYGVPVEAVVTTRFVRPEAIFPLEGRDTVQHDGRPLPVQPLSMLLEQGLGEPAEATWACLVLRVEEETFGLLVDRLLEEQEIVFKSYSPLLRRVRNVAGATILDSGRVCTVLNPTDLLRSLRHPRGSAAAGPVAGEATRTPPPGILLVEDSITTRAQEKRILEGAGFRVTTAVDGLDALRKLAGGRFEAVVSDVLMPNLDGFALTERIRADPRYRDLPVVLVTTLASPEDRQRGLDVGANAYITKRGFEQKELVGALQRLVRAPADIQ